MDSLKSFDHLNKRVSIASHNRPDAPERGLREIIKVFEISDLESKKTIAGLAIELKLPQPARASHRRSAAFSIPEQG